MDEKNAHGKKTPPPLRLHVHGRAVGQHVVQHLDRHLPRSRVSVRLRLRLRWWKVEVEVGVETTARVTHAVHGVPNRVPLRERRLRADPPPPQRVRLFRVHGDVLLSPGAFPRAQEVAPCPVRQAQQLQAERMEREYVHLGRHHRTFPQLPGHLRVERQHEDAMLRERPLYGLYDAQERGGLPRPGHGIQQQMMVVVVDVHAGARRCGAMQGRQHRLHDQARLALVAVHFACRFFFVVSFCFLPPP